MFFLQIPFGTACQSKLFEIYSVQWQKEKTRIWQNSNWFANELYEDTTSLHKQLKNAVLMLQDKLLKPN